MMIIVRWACMCADAYMQTHMMMIIVMLACMRADAYRYVDDDNDEDGYSDNDTDTLMMILTTMIYYVYTIFFLRILNFADAFD